MEEPRAIVVVGDGPTGLSAALLLAKKGFRVDVVGLDESPTHKALLHNYLGEADLPGPTFLERSRRQAERFGARLHKARALACEGGEGDRPFTVRTPEAAFTGHYLIVATGYEKEAVPGLALEAGPQGIRADADGRTSRDRVYAGGAAVRGRKSQVATSVGDGAAIAVDILSREAGKPTHDYDVLPAPPTAPAAPGSPK
jgi:thioredoxin reductase (NADPH)